MRRTASLEEDTDRFIKKRQIRPSNSPAVSSLLFARKPKSGFRLCVDYSKLNSITIPDRQPLPLFKEILRQLLKSKWVIKLDVKLAFHRLRIKEEDE